MMRSVYLVTLLISFGADAFSPLSLASTLTKEATATQTSSPAVLTRVAVVGATGRTGKYVVEELLEARNVEHIVGVVRDMDKAQETFADENDKLDFLKVDLTNEKQVEKQLSNVDAIVWCATGFSNNPSTTLLDRIKSIFGVVTKSTIDIVGLQALGKILAEKGDNNGCPRLVMCSSAGVTRPAWDDEKKARFPGAADIPIVRLNPFSILDVKRESEEVLRATGVEYCIVRPGGLNDEWPSGSRPVFSQGDVAVGRIHRQDVARVLVESLVTPEATGKTFEIIALAGYPRPGSIASALAKLSKDEDGAPSIESVAATYLTMQQLLPGEKQDSAALAMGQTYEELDEGKTGRLGKRGTEDAEAAAPKPSVSGYLQN